jgi:hypothetical protein
MPSTAKLMPRPPVRSCCAGVILPRKLLSVTQRNRSFTLRSGAGRYLPGQAAELIFGRPSDIKSVITFG